MAIIDTNDEFVLDQQEEITNPVETTEEGSTGDNPAWEPILNLIDPRVAPAVKTHLAEWDTNYRKTQSELSEARKANEAFQEFVGIDPGEIRISLQIAKNIADNPREVAKILAESTGMTLAEAKEVVKEEAQQESAEEFEFTDDDDPRLKQLWEQNQNLTRQQQEFFQQVEQREQEKEQKTLYDNYNKQIDLTWAKLAKDDPTLHPQNPAYSQDRMDNLFAHAATLAQRGHKDPFTAAYTAQKALIAPAPPPKPSPLFMPTNGNAPPAQESKDTSTPAGRRAAAAEIIAAMRSGG